MHRCVRAPLTAMGECNDRSNIALLIDGIIMALIIDSFDDVLYDRLSYDIKHVLSL